LHNLPGYSEQRISHRPLWVALSYQSQLCRNGENHGLRPSPKPGIERYPRHALNCVINHFIDTLGDALLERLIAYPSDRLPTPKLRDHHGDDWRDGKTCEAIGRPGIRLHL